MLCVFRPTFRCIPLLLSARILLWCSCRYEQGLIAAGPRIEQVTPTKKHMQTFGSTKQFPLASFILSVSFEVQKHSGLPEVPCVQLLFLCCRCLFFSSASSSPSAMSPMLTGPSDWAVPQASRLKYRQQFNSLDKQMTGYLTGTIYTYTVCVYMYVKSV